MSDPQNVHVNVPLKGVAAMPYKTNSDLPESVQNSLPAEAQSVWRDIYTSAYENYKDESKAIATAWAGLKRAGWEKGTDGEWVKITKNDYFSLTVPITKVDNDKHQVFGWANISHEWQTDDTGSLVLKQVEDLQGDLVDPDDLEIMAYRFTKNYRDGGTMHVKKNAATMIESTVFTVEKQQALGIPPGVVPVGWWIGFEVSNPDAWEGIKSGVYKAFSIEGSARRESVIEKAGGNPGWGSGGGESGSMTITRGSMTSSLSDKYIANLPNMSHEDLLSDYINMNATTQGPEHLAMSKEILSRMK